MLENNRLEEKNRLFFNLPINHRYTLLFGSEKAKEALIKQLQETYRLSKPVINEGVIEDVEEFRSVNKKLIDED